VTGLEMLGVAAKPIYYVFNILRSFLPGRKDASGFRVPRRTLILLPHNSYPAHWGIATNGTTELMHFGGSLKATNIAECAVQPSGINVLWPKYTEIETNLLMVEGRDGMHSSQDMIPKGAIGHISFTLVLTPLWGKRGEKLRLKLGVIDQFGNVHKVWLGFRFMGPLA
jgi:hypothetical protein